MSNHIDNFSQAALSPLPAVQEKAGPIPYGLTAEELGPVLDIPESDYPSIRCLFTHEKQGLSNGPSSRIVTIVFESVKHGEERRTIFLKKNDQAKKYEADRFRLLARNGVVTPALLATFTRAHDEVIVLEFMPVIGIDCSARDQVEGMLRQIARLNTIAERPAFVPDNPMSMSAEYDARVQCAIESIVISGFASAEQTKSWFSAYQQAQREAQQMSRAIVHGEMYFQQVGLLHVRASDNVALFDLATMHFGPRFIDVAGILRPLSDRSGISQIDLFAIYLEEYCRRGGRIESHVSAYHELRVIRLVNNCWSLPWWSRVWSDPESAKHVDEVAPAVDCITKDAAAISL
jgi:hypothetical protein